MAWPKRLHLPLLPSVLMGHRVIRGTAIFAGVFILVDLLVAAGLLAAATAAERGECI